MFRFILASVLALACISQADATGIAVVRQRIIVPAAQTVVVAPVTVQAVAVDHCPIQAAAVVQAYAVPSFSFHAAVVQPVVVRQAFVQQRVVVQRQVVQQRAVVRSRTVIR